MVVSLAIKALRPDVSIDQALGADDAAGILGQVRFSLFGGRFWFGALSLGDDIEDVAFGLDERNAAIGADQFELESQRGVAQFVESAALLHDVPDEKSLEEDECAKGIGVRREIARQRDAEGRQDPCHRPPLGGRGK